jgi:thioredoxin-like negative regulator of GroEL
MKPTCLPLAVLVGCLLAGVSTWAEETLGTAHALMGQGRAADAYALLKAQESERAGDPEFDYLLGIAALDSGNTLDAVFALERAVDEAPDNGPARGELARAYMTLGETRDARREFDKVREMELPTEVRRRIDQYVSTIEVYERTKETRIDPYLQFGLGYDSNVNSATDQGFVAVPALGGLQFQLDPGSRELSSGVWDLGAGLTFTSPLQAVQGLTVFGGVDLSYRVPFNERDFESKGGNGQVGLHLRRGREQFRVSAEASTMKLDGSTNFSNDRDIAGASGQWQHDFSETDQFTTFAQYSLVQYTDQRPRNVDRYTFGVGHTHVFAGVRGTPALFGSAFGGFEDARRSTGPQFSRDLFGLRLGGQIEVHERGSVFTSFTWQQSQYNNPDPAFLTERDEDFYDLYAGYRFQFDAHWSVSPTVRYNTNDSNIPTSNYDRVEAMLTIRNDF